MIWSTPEFKVGALVVAVTALIGIMSMKVANHPGLLKGTNDHWFTLKDAGGLVQGSAIKMAGINVGIIEEIKLDETGRAVIYISIRSDIPLTSSARIELKAQGILGDKHVEVVGGNPSDPPLKDGDQIVSVVDKGSLDTLVTEVNKITKSIGVVADALQSAVQGEGDTSTALGRIVKNVENLSRDLSEMSGRNKEKINDIVDSVHSVSATLDQILNDRSEDGLKAALKKATAGLARLDNTLKNIEEITEKVNKGDGTIGKLINDEKTVEELNTAISNVNEFLGGAQKLETSIDFHSEYLAENDLTKSFLGVKLQPGLDRYYEIQVVDDPKGVVNVTETTRTVNGAAPTIEEETKVFKSKVKFTALFAKNFYDFTVKGGLIENSGGVGFDYYFLRKKLRFSLEAFRFSDPYVRAFVRYNFLKGVYVIGGGDDIFSQENNSSVFFGAGIFLTNDDLKMFASKVSF